MKRVDLLNSDKSTTKQVNAFNHYRRDKTVNTSSSSKGFSTGSIFLIIFIVLFVIAVSRVLLDAPPLTFSGFLTSLSEVPSVNISTSFIDYTIAGSWGAFDFLRVFINTLITIANLLLFIVSLLINLLVVILWVLAYLFGF